MLLTHEQLGLLLDQEGVYKCSLHTKRFGFSFFGDGVKSLGNIIGFESPVQIGSVKFNNAFVIVYDLPNRDLYTGVCMLRLYCAQLCSLITSLTELDVLLNESSIFIKDKQSTITLTNSVKQSIISHIIFPLDTESSEFNCLSLGEENMKMFKFRALDSFEHLTWSIFKETQHDNI